MLVKPAFLVIFLKISVDGQAVMVSPPYKFPDNQTDFKLIKNETLRESLSKHVGEADDLLKGPLVKSPIVLPNNDQNKPNTSAEWIESENSTYHDSSKKTLPQHLVQGQLTGILAGVFVALSIIAYVSLLTWRKYLEHRYGNREMLVEDDDNDLKNFSI